MVDASFLIWAPLALLFFSAIVNAILKQRARDLCLKEFSGDIVLIRMKDGESIYGSLNVYPDSLEIEFLDARAALNNFTRQTYVLLKQRFEQIYCIYRLSPLPGTTRRAVWEKEIEQLRHPSLFRRVTRSLRNTYNILRDAFAQSVGMLIGIAKARNQTLNSIQSVDARANEVSQTLLGVLPNAYEPILEKYIGSFVIVQTLTNNATKEELGLLQDYSVQYLLLRDVTAAEALPPELVRAENPGAAVDIIFPRASTQVRHRARPVSA